VPKISKTCNFSKNHHQKILKINKNLKIKLKTMIFSMCGTRENPRESALFLKNITKITTFSPFEKVTKHRIFKKLQEKNVKSRFFGLRETLCEIPCLV